eukprot:gene4001-7257_t
MNGYMLKHLKLEKMAWKEVENVNTNKEKLMRLFINQQPDREYADFLIVEIKNE